MTIQLATEQNIEEIITLAHTIWPVAYGSILAPQQITYMLQLIYSEDALKTQMQQGQQFILAVQQQTPVGFAAYSPKNINTPQIYKLHKLYALPNQPIKGIGSIMLQYVCTQASLHGATQLELNVNKYNTATQFYTKNGFTTVKEEVIDIGNNYVMDDYVMVKNLL